MQKSTFICCICPSHLFYIYIHKHNKKWYGKAYRSSMVTFDMPGDIGEPPKPSYRLFPMSYLLLWLLLVEGTLSLTMGHWPACRAHDDSWGIPNGKVFLFHNRSRARKSDNRTYSKSYSGEKTGASLRRVLQHSGDSRKLFWVRRRNWGVRGRGAAIRLARSLLLPFLEVVSWGLGFFNI